MVILCLGSIVVLAAGNVQALLLMSGRSAASAVNKAVVLAFNVLGNILLVPRVGIVGAAVVWAASMALDTGLAAWQVRRGVGVSLSVGPIAYVVAVVTGVVALPSILVVLAWGQGTPQLLVAVLTSGLLLLGYCALDRRRLQLHELRGPGARERK
jgi:O-antigen/teichoic acid export membrane protein